MGIRVALTVALASLACSSSVFAQTDDPVIDDLVERGMELLHDDNVYASLAVFDAVLEIRPDHHTALSYRARALAESGQYEEARTAAHRAHEMEPDRRSTESLAWVYYEESDFDAAAPYFDEALAFGGNDAEFVGMAGVNDYYLDNPDRAVERLSRAIELDPDDYLWHWWRGEVYWETGKLGLALPDYDEAVVLDPNNDALIADRGDLKYEMGDLDGAYEDFNRAVEIDPEYEWAWSQLIQIQMERGNYFAMLDDSDRFTAATGNMTTPPKSLIYFSIGFVVFMFLAMGALVVVIAGLLIWHQRRMKTIQPPAPPMPPAVP